MTETIENFARVNLVLELTAQERGECIKAIHAEFPKHGKEAFSLASRPEETGVTFTERAMKIIRDVTAQGKHYKHSQKRRKVDRFGCRLTPELAKAVRTKMKREGIASIQTLLENLLKGWVSA